MSRDLTVGTLAPNDAAIAAPEVAQLALSMPPSAAGPQDSAKHVSASSPAVPDSILKAAEELHQYVREYIRNADQKAAFFFAGCTAMLAYLHAQETSARWLKPLATWQFFDMLAFVGMAGLALGAAGCLTVVFPRLGGSKRGIIYFGAIVEHDSSSEYAAEVLRTPPVDVARLKLQHVYDLAKVCRSKYRALVASFTAGAIGAGTAILYLLIGS